MIWIIGIVVGIIFVAWYCVEHCGWDIGSDGEQYNPEDFWDSDFDA